MSIPESHQQERLHSAYVRAVISHAEQHFIPIGEGDYGIDGFVKRIQKFSYTKNGITFNKYIPTGEIFEFQLKAKLNCKKKDGLIVYSLDNNAYQRFVEQVNTVIPPVLIVYDMPSEINKCVIQDEKQLLMMGCCYWKFMDRKALETKTAYIPSEQVFNVEAVNFILDQYKSVTQGIRNVSLA